MQVVTCFKKLWTNDGTAAMAGLATGAECWFKANTTPGQGYFDTDNINNWHRVDLAGSDRLFLVFWGRVLNAGGTTASTTASLSIVAAGSPYVPHGDPDFAPASSLDIGFITPGQWSNAALIAVTPSALIQRANYMRGRLLAYTLPGSCPQSGTGSGIRKAVQGVTAFDTCGLFPATDAAEAPYTLFDYSWYASIGHWPRPQTAVKSDLTAADAAFLADSLSCKGLDRVWIAANFFQNFTGATLANIRVKGGLYAIGYSDDTLVNGSRGPMSRSLARTF